MLKRHCLRCGKVCLEVTTAKETIWNCPDQHGVIFREPLPLQEPESSDLNDSGAGAVDQSPEQPAALSTSPAGPRALN